MALEPLAPAPIPIAPVSEGGLLTWARDLVRALRNALDAMVRRLNFAYPQEGDWTPTVTALSTAGTPVYTTQTGRYTKVGNTVLIWGSIDLSGWTGTPAGDVVINGLPFEPENTTSFVIGWFAGINMTANYNTLFMHTGSEDGDLILAESGDAVAATRVQASAITAADLLLVFSGSYQTSAT